MQKFGCAIGFLALVLLLQDCLVPVESVRVRVVKVKRQDSHYAKRQVSRNTYTDVPLAGDPDAESFPVNNLRPQDNPYNAGNQPADYPLNNNIPYDDQNRGSTTPTNPDRYYPGSNNNNNNNNARPNYGGDQTYKEPQNRPDPSSSPQKEGKGEDCPGCGHSIPGEAGVDYPNYNTPPKTAFSCSNQQWSGYYADTEARCQVFWICQKNRADAFLCPNGTIFNQQVFVCDWWFNSDCNTAADYYSRNQYLYAGPTVDLFGNTITPYREPTQKQPVRLEARPADSEQSQSRPPAVTPQVRPTQASRQQQQAPQRPNTQAPRVQQQLPQRQQQVPPRTQQQLPSRPQQQVPSRQQQQPQRQTVTQTNIASTGGYSSSTAVTGGYSSTAAVSNRRNDDYPAATTPPAYIKRTQPQQQVQKTDYRNDRLKQTQNNYPVPGNSLAAVDGDFGLKMNNYKAAVEYIEPARQTQYQPVDRAEEERRLKNDRAEAERQAAKNKNRGNNNNYPTNTNQGNFPTNTNQAAYPNNNQGGYSNTNRGGYSNNNQGGYSSAPAAGGYSSPGYSSAAYTQTESPVIRRNDEQLPRQPLYSATAYKPESLGFGQKVQQQRSSSKSSAVQYRDQQEAGSFSSEVPSAALLYSSTTKRNALDYDTENTTPYTLSHEDEDLVAATVSSLRYGEVVAKPSIYSTEFEAPSIEATTTTPAPLTFGQKLTRAAKKRNTSNWGNWRTMLLGDY